MLGPTRVALTQTLIAGTVSRALAGAHGCLVTEPSVPASVLVVKLKARNSSITLNDTLRTFTLAMFRRHTLSVNSTQRLAMSKLTTNAFPSLRTRALACICIASTMTGTVISALFERTIGSHESSTAVTGVGSNTRSYAMAVLNALGLGAVLIHVPLGLALASVWRRARSVSRAVVDAASARGLVACLTLPPTVTHTEIRLYAHTVLLTAIGADRFLAKFTSVAFKAQTLVGEFGREVHVSVTTCHVRSVASSKRAFEAFLLKVDLTSATFTVNLSYLEQGSVSGQHVHRRSLIGFLSGVKSFVRISHIVGRLIMHR
jgi:hypothetical protein